MEVDAEIHSHASSESPVKKKEEGFYEQDRGGGGGSRLWWGNLQRQLNSKEVTNFRPTAVEPHRTGLDPQHGRDSCVDGSIWGGPGNVIDPWCMSQLSGSHYLWWDTLLTPDKARRALVLPQLNVPDLFSCPSMGELTLLEEAGSRGEREEG